jgi:hypothetical protein
MDRPPPGTGEWEATGERLLARGTMTINSNASSHGEKDGLRSSALHRQAISLDEDLTKSFVIVSRDVVDFERLLQLNKLLAAHFPKTAMSGDFVH